jgi:hypothetical protein
MVASSSTLGYTEGLSCWVTAVTERLLSIHEPSHDIGTITTKIHNRSSPILDRISEPIVNSLEQPISIDHDHP